MIHTTHPCDRVHRSYPSLAECLWPDAAWVVGSGPHAVLAHCDMLSVTLFDTEVEALKRLERLGATGCGHTCSGSHERHLLAVPLGDEAAGRHHRRVSGRSSRAEAR